MRNYKTITLLMSMLFIFGACAQKKAGSTNVTNNYPGGGGSGSGGGGGTGTTNPIETGGATGCSDGVARSGATRCYYKNIPRIVVSGPGTFGGIYWSSTNLPSSISQNQFRTDASFRVRIKPVRPMANETSLQGRKCAGNLSNIWDKLKVLISLRRKNDPFSNYVDFTANVDTYSSTKDMFVPGGTSDPYILEVVGVQSNSRCKPEYGSPMSGCPNAFYDIPLNTNVTSNPTECVAFEIQYSTDDTYDLPN